MKKRKFAEGGVTDRDEDERLKASILAGGFTPKNEQTIMAGGLGPTRTARSEPAIGGGLKRGESLIGRAANAIGRSLVPGGVGAEASAAEAMKKKKEREERGYKSGGSIMSENDPRKGRGRHGDTNYNPNYDLVPTQKERGAMQQEVEDERLRKMDKRPNLGKMFKSGGYVKSADGCVKRGKTKGTMVKM